MTYSTVVVSTAQELHRHQHIENENSCQDFHLYVLCSGDRSAHAGLSLNSAGPGLADMIVLQKRRNQLAHLDEIMVCC
jgi:hypothetical protein